MFRNRKLALLLAAVLAVALVASACGGGGGEPSEQPEETEQPEEAQDQADGQETEPEEEPMPAQEITVNLGTEPPSLDPAIAVDTTSFTVLNAIFEGLARRTPEGEYEPAMAADWTVSDDQLTYTFELRDGITWSNGDPVTAHDFEYSWKRGIDPRTASQYAYQLYYLEGAQEVNTLEAPDPENTDAYPEGADDPAYQEDLEAWEAQVDEMLDDVGVTALDEKTLEVTLTTPTPYWIQLTAFITYLPVNQSVVEGNEAWAAEAETIVSNGPFVITQWTHEDQIVLEKNPDYWDAGTVQLEKMVMPMVNDENTALTLFENNELDINNQVPTPDIPRLLESGQLHQAPYYGTYYYTLNIMDEPLSDVRVRQALAYAINREAIVENVTRGGQLPAYAWVPPGSTNPVSGEDFRTEGGALFDYDPERARQLLEEAGYPGGEGFPTLELSYNESEAHKAIAEAVQQMWSQELGVDVQLSVAEWQVHLAKMNESDYEIARIGWIGDYLDPMTFMDLMVTDGGFNRGGYSNAEYDELVDTAKNTADQSVRMESMHAAEEIMIEDMPLVPIYFYVNLYQQKPWVKGTVRHATSIAEYKWAHVEAH